MTAWFAFDWEALQKDARPLPCSICEAKTPQVHVAAIEHAAPQTLEPARISHGWLGREGFLELELCVPCGHARWFGREYLHLHDAAFLRHHVVDEPGRRCLACRASDALLVDTVHEHNQVSVPVAVTPAVAPKKRHWLTLFSRDRPEGHFALRVCRPCGAVEWYAWDLGAIREDPAAGVSAVGDALEAGERGNGPYR